MANRFGSTIGRLSAVALVAASAHCGSSVELRSSGNSGGAGSGGGGGSTTAADAGPDAADDAGGSCGGEALEAGFVIATELSPQHPASDVDDYELSGTLSYLGPITVPIASHPAFDRELRIAHSDGSESVLQYYLPLDLELPVVLQAPYSITFRQRWGFEGYAVGLLITRPTSGLPPLLFVAEGGQYGRAFAPDDPLMSPLAVYQHEDASCPTEPYPQCNGTIYLDQLRFDSSTGGAITDLTLYQGETGLLPVFGDDFLMVNLSSTRIEHDCPDASGGRTSFVAINQSAP